MKLPALVLGGCLLAAQLRAIDDYRPGPGPDSLPQPGVPRGELLEYSLGRSAIYPGTTREYWIYVPAEYRGDKPACLYVGQDGVQFDAPAVFDNLIAKGEMPVTIGVFVKPGVVPAAGPSALPRYDRSYEYDSLGDAYARFLLEELLPDAESKRTPDGRPIRISRKPADRAIGGLSSGAICAFTVAWERPGSFSRVFSAVGTYVGLRGGEVYPTLIRKFEPKPIRVFLQDGSHDLDIYGGDWWMANQTMERALEFSGYEVTHAWGDGHHNGAQATAIFPDAMRWLWKGWPAPVGNGPTGNEFLNRILIPGRGWHVAARGLGAVGGLAADHSGDLFFCDTRSDRTYRLLPDGGVAVVLADSHRATGQAFGADGRLYAAAGGTRSVVAYADGGRGPAETIARGIRGDDLVVAHDGDIYVTEPPPETGGAPSRVWLIRPGGAPEVVGTGIRSAGGIALSPDQSLLYVGDARSHWVYSFVLRPDGTLADKQRYDDLHEPDSADSSGAGGMQADAEGRLYVASAMGIQVCDQAGRVECIIPTPEGGAAGVAFGGPGFRTLYAACGGTLYSRRVRAAGARGWDAPNEPAPPKL